MLKVLALFFGFSFAAVAADDGFIWIDANTRIKATAPVKPTSAAGGASAPEKKAPESAKKDPKKEKPKK